jgi:hypothetical protein
MALANFLVFGLFLIAWMAVMGAYLYFARCVAPAAVQNWAKEQGYQIINKRNAGPLERWSYARGSGHQIYRLVILDINGHTRSGLARVGIPYWFCLSSDRCPVEARWDAPQAVFQPIKPVTRRTVVYCAVADLVVVFLLLVLETGLLFVVGMCVDEIWNGALGLNRRLGWAPPSGGPGETRFFMAQILGFAALCVAAIVTLTAAWFGMIRGKRWGYSCHLIGSALVVAIPGGLFYGLPSLAIALRPAFKEYFRGLGKPKPVTDLSQLL